MGLLKHVILPYFGAFHLFTVVCMLPTFRKDFVAMAYHYDDDQKNNLTYVEHHLLDAAAGFHAAMALACLLGVVVETAQFRGRIATMEVVLWFFDWYGSLQVTEIESTVMAVNLGLSVVATIIHYREPGIFTTDKKDKKQ